jgi:hypothetical protein
MTSDEIDALAGPWIERDDNRAKWRQLVEAVELNSSFALFVVVVPNAEIGRAVTASLESLAQALRRTSVSASLQGGEPAVRRLLDARQPCLAVMSTVGDWRRPSFDQLRIALMQVNQRRDFVAARLGGPLFVVVDDEGRQALIEVAPDLWSVRTTEFRFRSGHELEVDTALGRWLSADELAGMLGLSSDSGVTMRSDMASLEVPIPAAIELVGREQALADLNTLSLGPERIVVLEGLAGSGRRSLAARFVADYGARWDRVVWLDAVVEKEMLAGIHSVLLALRPELTPPRAERDLLAAYMRETSRQRALIVVCNAAFDWPAPRGESFAIVTSNDARSAKAKVKLRGLRAEQIGELWQRLTDEPLPEALMRGTAVTPEIVLAVARAPARMMAGFNGGNLWTAAYLRRPEPASDEGKALWRWLGPLGIIPGGIPRAYLSAAELNALPELLELGLVVERGETLEVVSTELFWHSRLSCRRALEFALQHRERVLANRSSVFERRLLRAAYESIRDLEFAERKWPLELLDLVESITSVQLPCERANWLTRVAGQHRGTAAIEQYAIALQYELACRELSNLDARLQTLRKLIEGSEDPALAQLLARMTFEVALHVGDRRRIQSSLTMDLGVSPARMNCFVRTWSGDADLPTEFGSDLQAALAAKLFAGILDTELFQRAVDPSEPLPVRHFGYVGLALIGIARHSGDTLAALDGVRSTAEQWGAPLPLLRADLLDAEADEAAGRPAAALIKLDALADRLDAYLGRHAPEVIRVLMKRMTFASHLGDGAEALTLADECWTRAREVDRVAPAVYEALARVYLQHGNADRAKQVARRWRTAHSDDPQSVQRAVEIEREAIDHRYQADLADLEHRSGPKPH